ncbi:hypothetical protein AMS68_001574 [Peltaster fructicola]|uniref:Glycosyl transferase CAP10 domain-containing protein n=1 Tax=Peltaster fructicola TaxID=286661 RepID=A0A6H0XMT3_9PEZI|nr:hypothetical protein AMS68_001574 [Peltaster fructicola]
MLVAGVSIVVMLGQHLRPGSSSTVGGHLGYSQQRSSAPVQLTDNTIHPIAQLANSAQAEWSKTLNQQSKTLDAAVAEYRRRYKMSPPPNFDKWFEFARTRDVQIIDEYDTIYHSLLPFWALSPATIRARAREAIGHAENRLVGLLLRDGKTVRVEGGDDWQQRATVGLVEHFTEYLPDMDLAFNIHDEPRVALSSAGLDGLVAAGLHEIASTGLTLQNAFSPRPADVSAGQRIEEVKTTRFNYFPHQPTWGSAKVSCAASTPVGCLQEAADDLSTYALGDLGFVYNRTAFTDICNSPSLETSHGFFERANAFSVTHDLFPIFSQSKMSSFQDITYPSPWYWYDKAPYFEAMDMEWSKKENKMWWRGSTTGGYTQDGGWRRQHRQQLVRKINAPDKAKILTPRWSLTDTERQDHKSLFDVHFSSVVQCDVGDCAAQNEFFTLAPVADQQESWKSKYLLDIDGNAYSGRFYALLKSNSLVFKMAVFREWHEEWIKPWVHYIPLSLRGEEILEAVRYVDAEPEGQELGSLMAETSSQWAKSALRKEDFEAWFFRLLLEYGRLVDDNRSNIGFT